MQNIYRSKMASKRDVDLVHVVLNRTNYQQEAVEAAELELQNRGVLSVDESYPEYELRLKKLKRALLKELRPKSPDDTRKKTQQYEPKYDWSWMHWSHFFHLVNFYLVGWALLMITKMPFINTHWGYLLLLWIFVGIWQMSSISKSKTKRPYHLYTRLVSSALVTFMFSYVSWIHGNELFGRNHITMFLVLLVFTGIPSIFIYHFFEGRFANPKVYILKFFKIPALVSLVFLLILLVVQKQLFVSEKKLTWDERYPLQVSDFRGYPDLLTHFDGAITSGFDYQFVDESLSYFNAVCHTHETWINPWDKDDYFLLQHERYHFNITEVVTRMTRKAIVNSLRNGQSSKEDILAIISDHNTIRSEMQDAYDDQTNHSQKQDQQALWQNKIDSLLIELDAYWTSDVLKFSEASDSSTFYRDLNQDAIGDYHLISPLLPGEKRYASHYKFEKLNETDKSISYWFQGEKERSRNLVGAAEVVIKQIGDTLIRSYLDQNSEAILNDDDCHQVVQIKTGDKILEYYLDTNGIRVKNKQNVFFKTILLDRLDRAIIRKYYNEMGQQIVNGDGNCVLNSYYLDDGPFASEIRNFDFEGKPIADKKGVHLKVWENDSLGRTTSFSKFNLKGHPVDFYYSINYSYNELGKLTMKTFEDQAGNLVENRYRVAKVTWADDRYGNISRESTYNRNNVLTLNNEVATTYKKYDSANNMILWAEYDTGNRLIFDRDDFGKVKYRSDSLGRTIEIVNYNAYDYPITSALGGRMERRLFDSSGLVMNVHYTDINSKPDTARDGSAAYILVRDSSGNELLKEFYNLQGDLHAVKQDVCTFKYSYDRNGNKIAARFLNVEGKLARANGGISINRYKYSEDNRMIERSYYDSMDQLALYDGAAVIRYQYDLNGNAIEVRKFDVDEELLDSGVSIIQQKYNEQNRLVSRLEKNAKNQLVEAGIAQFIYLYDNRGNMVDEKYYDHLGEPASDENSIHHINYMYSGKNLVEQTHYNRYGDLIQQSEGNRVVKYIYSRDYLGNTTEETRIYFVNGRIKPDLDTLVIKFDYDLYDRVVAKTYFDQKNKPVLFSDSYHNVRFERNPSGDILRVEYYDIDGNLTENEKGIAVESNYYSLNGKKTSKKYNLSQFKELDSP